MNPEQLIQQIDRGRIEAVYFFSGDEAYRKEEAVDTLVARVVEPGTEAFCVDVLRGDESDAAAILTSASLVPMMADRRVVVVRDFHKLPQKDREAVADYAERPAPSTVLVLEAPRVNLKTRLYERLAAAAVSVVFYPLFPERVPAWLQQQAKRYGKRLTPEAAHQMQEIVGTDLGELAGEVEKLAVFVGGRDTIAAGDVESTLGPVRAGTVFDIAEAVGEKDLARALVAYERAIDGGDAPQAIVALFVRHLVILWKIRFLKRDRRTDDDIKKKLQLGWGFNRFYNRYAAQSRLLAGRDLLSGFEALYEADTALKSSALPPELVMRRLLFTLCTGHAA
ncbi:MAG: DNA polymerase III subunit delta [Gemmatimonadetes bacterium]|nr:DNA polymerase III subunit delta [Gemmatimonadota bacterium]MYB62146.1 DNA polymerase III subunit delta [Gemmatimonadota bacterium]